MFGFFLWVGIESMALLNKMGDSWLQKSLKIFIYRRMISLAQSLVEGIGDQEKFLFLRQDKHIITSYQDFLLLVKSSLILLQKIPSKSYDYFEMKLALCFLDECKIRRDKLSCIFKQLNKGVFVDKTKVRFFRKGLFRKNCYFCSRPIFNSFSARTAIELDGKEKSVLGCSTCQKKLTRHNQVKILYFMKSGKRLHWSNLTDYSPSINYWYMNQ